MYQLSMVGSYPYAEKYIVNLPEDEVIQKIVDLKEKEPSLQVPSAKPPFFSLTDSKSEYEYHVFFLLKDGKTVLSCFVRNIDRYTTAIKLVSTGTGPEFLNTKEINARSYFVLRDLNSKENRQYKRDFEKQILNKLGVEWKKDKW